MAMTGVSQLGEASSRVEVRFGTTQPQRRWTVLIRIILAIPRIHRALLRGDRCLRRGGPRLVRRPVHRTPARIVRQVPARLRAVEHTRQRLRVPADRHLPAVRPRPGSELSGGRDRDDRSTQPVRRVLPHHPRGPGRHRLRGHHLRDAGLQLHHLDHHPGDRTDAGPHLRCVGGRHPLADPYVRVLLDAHVVLPERPPRRQGLPREAHGGHDVGHRGVATGSSHPAPGTDAVHPVCPVRGAGADAGMGIRPAHRRRPRGPTARPSRDAHDGATDGTAVPRRRAGCRPRCRPTTPTAGRRPRCRAGCRATTPTAGRRPRCRAGCRATTPTAGRRPRCRAPVPRHHPHRRARCPRCRCRG